ncbi:MliC family protein [Nodosilinea sp. LEGE 07088]|uniref:MliC family protein n=1 Tax=Nodosilinea sp. LEGE 07088 TaxID=2777968 RepID=UPI00187E1089|nr:MliC family protein [Nodosilinea sp. LEGE 07088]MBE9138577.1 MliC family protein [Nodosilinea sp. LEGE 07088]
MTFTIKASIVAIALTGLALAGCNSTPDTSVSDDPVATDEAMTADDSMANGDVVVFECPGGEIITAQFTDAPAAIVTLPDQEPVTLPATEAASGARYSDGTTTFWNKGDEALVEVDDAMVLSGCQAQS